MAAQKLLYIVSYYDQQSGPPDQRTSGSADQRISGLADQRINGSADQRTSGSADQRISGSADQQISGPADQRISGPDQRIIGPVTMDQLISGSADRTKRSTDQLVHGFCKVLPFCTCQLLSTHAPAFRSLQVHSPRDCTFDKLVHVISNIMIMSCMSFWQPSSTLFDVWDLLFEEPYPTLSVVIQSWMCGLRSSSLPLRCLVW